MMIDCPSCGRKIALPYTYDKAKLLESIKKRIENLSTSGTAVSIYYDGYYSAISEVSIIINNELDKLK